MARCVFSLMILCGMLRPFAAISADSNRILVHGHRGARARRPENTIPAFRYALAEGVDALEMDMAVTKDGVIVISHDPVLQPPVCTAAALRFTN